MSKIESLSDDSKSCGEEPNGGGKGRALQCKIPMRIRYHYASHLIDEEAEVRRG